MKGMIFTSFERFLERTYGEGLADDVFGAANLTSGGAYTSVGFYPPAEFMEIAGRTSSRVRQPVPNLLRAFGRYLFGELASGHAAMMRCYNDPVHLLSEIENVIHVNVRKLYTDTQLPRFDVEERIGASRIVLRYRSARPLADLAQGLIEGCTAHFGVASHSTLERYDIGNDGTEARFTLTIEGADDGEERRRRGRPAQA